MRDKRIRFAVAGGADSPAIWRLYVGEYAPDEPWTRSTLLCLDGSRSWLQRYYKSYLSVSGFAPRSLRGGRGGDTKGGEPNAARFKQR